MQTEKDGCLELFYYGIVIVALFGIVLFLAGHLLGEELFIAWGFIAAYGAVLTLIGAAITEAIIARESEGQDEEVSSKGQ